jgi:hypothetical protein
LEGQSSVTAPLPLGFVIFKAANSIHSSIEKTWQVAAARPLFRWTFLAATCQVWMKSFGREFNAKSVAA